MYIRNNEECRNSLLICLPPLICATSIDVVDVIDEPEFVLLWPVDTGRLGASCWRLSAIDSIISSFSG